MLNRILLLSAPVLLLASCGPAADGSAQPEQGGMFTFVLFGGMMLFMYLLMIRPQQKKAKEHKELMSAISKGDEVLTTAGILGKVNKITDEYATVEMVDGVLLTIQKGHITHTLPKGTIKTYKESK